MSATRWRVVRQDDNGNRFIVQECEDEAEARRVVERFEALWHKQTYWVEASEGTEG